MNTSNGFTIIEVLVTILLLGIMMAALFYTLSGSLSLNSQSQYQMNKNSTAQSIVENIQTAWSILPTSGASNYDHACIANFTVPSGYTVKFQNLDGRAQPLSATQYSFANVTTCNTDQTGAKEGSSTVPPVMRRVTVISGNQSLDSTLTVDILRPLP